MLLRNQKVELFKCALIFNALRFQQKLLQKTWYGFAMQFVSSRTKESVLRCSIPPYQLIQPIGQYQLVLEVTAGLTNSLKYFLSEMVFSKSVFSESNFQNSILSIFPIFANFSRDSKIE